GVIKSGGATMAYDTTHTFQVGDTVFVVGKYTWGAGAASVIWVSPSPSSFGGATEPSGGVLSLDTADITGSPLSIQTWIIRQNSTTQGAGVIDEVRFSKTWAGVT